MKILALDLATHTGWASGPVGNPSSYGTKVLPPPAGALGRFFAAYKIWLEFMIAIEMPDIVVFEAPILAAKTTVDTARALMGLAALTELITFNRAIKCREAHLQSVKKFFAGNGRAGKPEMMRMAASYGWPCQDDNAADALAVFCYASHLIDPKASARFALGPLGAAP